MTVKLQDTRAVRWALDAINKDVETRATYTPDHQKLSSYHTQFLFLPCEYQYGLPCWDLISSYVTRERTAYTVDPFIMFEYDRGAGSFPVPLPVTDQHNLLQKPAFIAGDLVKVKDFNVFYNLDSLRENGVKFIRKRVNLQLRSRKIHFFRDVHKVPEFTPLSNSTVITGWFTEYMKAWMYIGVPEYWKPLVDNGYMFRPVKQFMPNDMWTERYYLYRPE